MCPHCGSDSPLVYRGLTAYCTACGAARAPLSAPSVNLAGVPSKVGGTFAAVVGWVFLSFGLAWALGAGLLFWALFRVTAVALAFSLPIALVALAVGVPLLLVSRHMRKSAALGRRQALEEALMAWAGQRGSATAQEAGRALGISASEADGILTVVAKREPERLAMDVGDDGQIRYRPLRSRDAARPEEEEDVFARRVRIPDDSPQRGPTDADAVGSYEEDEEGQSTQGKRRV
jgi:hypothetical protein